ncbi:MAG: hypothetical protein PW788_03895 [Micavibrio sp.]|nr:hypothetical protein [Micavibrio sp.]
MMPKVYTLYCAILLCGLAFADYRGMVFTSWMTGQGVANKAANHYHK